MFFTELLLGPSWPSPSPAIPELALVIVTTCLGGPMGSLSDPENVDSMIVIR